MSFQPIYTRHVYIGLEPSQAFDVVHGSSFEHRLLSPKPAAMEHQRLTLGDVRLESGRYDFPVIAQGSMPMNAVCIGFMAEGGDVTRYNTAMIGADEIQIYPAGVELLYHTSGASRWVNFIVPEERLQQAAFARKRRSLVLPTLAASSVRLRAGGRRALTCLTDDAMHIARHLHPVGGMAPDLAKEICESLLTGYVNALSDATTVHKAKSSSAERRHHDLIVACERFVLSGNEADVGLAEIARRSGYSLRSLELIFRRSVGMTPGRWFMTARLNGALRDLLTCDPACTVSDIAAKWGFQHMSRFAQYYCKAFGELPHDTLNRPRI